MKYRNVLFGYRYDGGQIVIHEKNATVYKNICEAYINGKSLKSIADCLNEKGVEYVDGVSGWNKARIVRLISDKRYIGNEAYPAIILNETYDKVQSIKNQRSTQTETDRNDGIFRLTIAVKCPICGDIMIRQGKCRRKDASQWTCKNAECGKTINKNDDEFLSEITELMNRVIANPDIIVIQSDTQLDPNSEERNSEENIDGKSGGLNIDVRSIRKSLTESAASRYEEINSERSRTQLLKDIFKASENLSTFSSELLERTTTAIKLYSDGTIGLVFDNRQEIKKGD